MNMLPAGHRGVAQGALALLLTLAVFVVLAACGEEQATEPTPTSIPGPTDAPTSIPVPTSRPTPEPIRTLEHSEIQEPTASPAPTAFRTSMPSPTPAAAPTPAAVPTSEPIQTSAPTPTPTATPVSEPTHTSAATSVLSPVLVRDLEYNYTMVLPDGWNQHRKGRHRRDSPWAWLTISSQILPDGNTLGQFSQFVQNNLQKDWWPTASLFEVYSVEEGRTHGQPTKRIRYRVQEYPQYCVLDVEESVVVVQILPGNPQGFRIRGVDVRARHRKSRADAGTDTGSFSDINQAGRVLQAVHVGERGDHTGGRHR